jgi:hypothetical protein
MRASEIAYGVFAAIAFALCLYFGLIHLIWQDVAIFAVCAVAFIGATILARRS